MESGLLNNTDHFSTSWLALVYIQSQIVLLCFQYFTVNDLRHCLAVLVSTICVPLNVVSGIWYSERDTWVNKQIIHHLGFITANSLECSRDWAWKRRPSSQRPASHSLTVGRFLLFSNNFMLYSHDRLCYNEPSIMLTRACSLSRLRWSLSEQRWDRRPVCTLDFYIVQINSGNQFVPSDFGTSRDADLYLQVSLVQVVQSHFLQPGPLQLWQALDRYRLQSHALTQHGCPRVVPLPWGERRVNWRGLNYKHCLMLPNPL